MKRQPYFAPHNNKGTRPMQKPMAPKPAPAKITIEQKADGTFEIRHNVAAGPAFVIGILSLMINTLAAEIAQVNNMIIDPNRPGTGPIPEYKPVEVPEPETNKVS